MKMKREISGELKLERTLGNLQVMENRLHRNNGIRMNGSIENPAFLTVGIAREQQRQV